MKILKLLVGVAMIFLASQTFAQSTIQLTNSTPANVWTAAYQILGDIGQPLTIRTKNGVQSVTLTDNIEYTDAIEILSVSSLPEPGYAITWFIHTFQIPDGNYVVPVSQDFMDAGDWSPQPSDWAAFIPSVPEPSTNSVFLHGFDLAPLIETSGAQFMVVASWVLAACSVLIAYRFIRNRLKARSISRGP